MSVIINILIFLAIFGYALYTLVKFFKRSKQGKCGTCDIDRDCCGTEQHTANHFLIRYMLNCRYLPFTTNSLSSTSISTCLTSV
ncbi:virus attachment p12 family protein [Staphylococcus aureus]|nr:virus attachment p12 family protein [Staphylococcus aureus]